MLDIQTRIVFFCAALLTLSLGIASAACAQATQADSPTEPNAAVDDIDIPFGWKKGDQFEYSLTTKKVSTRGKLAERQRDISLSVIEESKDSVIVEFRVIPNVSLDDLKDIEQVNGGIELTEMAEDLVIKVEIGREGIVRDILNWDDVEKVVDHVESMMREAISDMNLSKEKMDGIEKIFQLQKSRPVIEQNMLEPLNQLVMMTGISVSSTTPYRGETTTSMMMTDEVPASETYTVESFDKKTSIVNVLWTQVVEGEEAASVLETGFLAYAKRMGVPDSKMTPLHLDGRLAYSSSDTWIDVTTGWPEKIVWHSEGKNISNGKDGATTDIVIERIRPKQ